MGERVVRVESSEFKETEIGLIPKDWEVVRLGEVCNYYLGRTPPRNENQSWINGTFPWVSISDMKDYGRINSTKEKITQYALEKYFRGKISKKGTLLMSFKLTIGRTSILEIDAVHNEAIISIFPKNEKISKYFLFYYLPTIDYSNYIDKAVKGNTLNRSKIDNIKLPLPPLTEQKAIAYVLSTIQEAIEKTEQVIKATKELKKSLMDHLFTYGPVSLEDTEKVELKETEIGLIPKDWEVVRLGEVAEIKGGKRLPKGNKFADCYTQYPYIRVVDFKNNSVDITNLRFLTPEQHQLLSRYIITKEDVYISIAGTIGLVGSIPPELDGAHLTENAARIILNKKMVNQKFLVFALSNRTGQEQIQVRATKTSQPKLALARIKDIIIPLPPLPIQQKIAEILKAVDEKIQAEENKKKALESLFKSMLHNLMTGKLRVNLEVET